MLAAKIHRYASSMGDRLVSSFTAQLCNRDAEMLSYELDNRVDADITRRMVEEIP